MVEKSNLLIVTGPQGSGNHLFAKLFNLHPDVYGWNMNRYWQGHDMEPFNEYWWNPSNLHKFNWNLNTYFVTSISCPYCKNRMVDDKNSLESLYPEVSKEFHPTKNGNLKPNEIYYRSTRKIWWKCPNGKDHEWKGEVRFRFKVDKNKKIHITKCPFCIGKKVSITNCLETTHQNITKEFHPTKNGDLTPRNIYSGSHKKIWFVCNKGHEWETRLYVRTSMGSNCPYCAGNRKK